MMKKMMICLTALIFAFSMTAFADDKAEDIQAPEVKKIDT